MKKIIISFAVLLLVLCGVLFYRASSFFENKQYVVDAPMIPVTVDEQAVLSRFSKAIQIPTISFDDRSQFDQDAFIAFQDYLKENSHGFINTLNLQSSMISVCFTT